MITDERLKQLMEQVGMPDSRSLMQALRQCDMEATLAERGRCDKFCEDVRRVLVGTLTDPLPGTLAYDVWNKISEAEVSGYNECLSDYDL